MINRIEHLSQIVLSSHKKMLAVAPTYVKVKTIRSDCHILNKYLSNINNLI